jgi:hypothetical protein
MVPLVIEFFVGRANASSARDDANTYAISVLGKRDRDSETSWAVRVSVSLAYAGAPAGRRGCARHGLTPILLRWFKYIQNEIAVTMHGPRWRLSNR